MSILRGLRSDPAGRGGPIEGGAAAGGIGIGVGSCLTTDASAAAAAGMPIAVAMPGGMNLGTYRPPPGAATGAAAGPRTDQGDALPFGTAARGPSAMAESR